VLFRFHIYDLTTPIHARCGMDVMRQKNATVMGIFGELRHGKMIGTAAFATSLLGLFTFWNSHFLNLLRNKCQAARCVEDTFRQEVNDDLFYKTYDHMISGLNGLKKSSNKARPRNIQQVYGRLNQMC
jgi:hypothetical protein